MLDRLKLVLNQWAHQSLFLVPCEVTARDVGIVRRLMSLLGAKINQTWFHAVAVAENCACLGKDCSHRETEENDAHYGRPTRLQLPRAAESCSLCSHWHNGTKEVPLDVNASSVAVEK